jgi:hypothetical protein
MSAISSVVFGGTTHAAGQFFTTGQRPGTSDLPATASDVKRVPEAATKADAVQLSAAAEAQLLRSQGQDVAQIAAELGLPQASVTSYLGITDGVQTVVAAATAEVEAQTAETTLPTAAI